MNIIQIIISVLIIVLGPYVLSYTIPGYSEIGFISSNPKVIFTAFISLLYSIGLLLPSISAIFATKRLEKDEEDKMTIMNTWSVTLLGSMLFLCLSYANTWGYDGKILKGILIFCVVFTNVLTSGSYVEKCYDPKKDKCEIDKSLPYLSFVILNGIVLLGIIRHFNDSIVPNKHLNVMRNFFDLQNCGNNDELPADVENTCKWIEENKLKTEKLEMIRKDKRNMAVTKSKQRKDALHALSTKGKNKVSNFRQSLKKVESKPSKNAEVLKNAMDEAVNSENAIANPDILDKLDTHTIEVPKNKNIILPAGVRPIGKSTGRTKPKLMSEV